MAPGPEDALETLRLALAVTKSWREGRPGEDWRNLARNADTSLGLGALGFDSCGRVAKDLYCLVQLLDL